MNAALGRARHGALILGYVVIFSILSYHLWFDKPLLESMYWTVITITGVGYSQGIGQQIGEARQLLSIVVIVVGMTSMAYTVGMLIQAIVEGQLDQALGAKRMTKVIDKLRGHVIICGFGRIGQNLSHRLARHRVPFIVIDPCAESIAEAKSHEFLFLEGDATDETSLLAAGIERAATLVIALQNDSNNVFLTLTARNMNPDLRIIARGEHPRTEKKLFQAGANEVVMPAVIGAERVAEMIVKTKSADLLSCVGHELALNAELEEFTFSAESAYVGRTIREAEEKFQVMIVAVHRTGCETIFNPRDDERLYSGDNVVVMGPEADIEDFFETCVAPSEKPALV